MITERSRSYDAIDIAKFICSILIVILHTNPVPKYQSIIYPITHIAVPFFMMTSSYLFTTKVDKVYGEDEKKKLVKSYIVNLLNLYCIWFLIALPFTIYNKGWFESGLIKGMLIFFRNLVFASTWRSSWFMMTLIIDTFILYLLLSKNNRVLNRIVYVVSFILLFICILSSTYSNLLFVIPNVENFYDMYVHYFTLPYTSLPIGFSYILIGRLLARSEIKGSKKQEYLLGLLISLCLLVIEGQIAYRLDLFKYNDDVYFMLIPVCIYLIKYCIAESKHFLHARELRTTSTITYCLHGSLVDTFGMGGVQCILILISCWAASAFYMRKNIIKITH